MSHKRETIFEVQALLVGSAPVSGTAAARHSLSPHAPSLAGLTAAVFRSQVLCIGFDTKRQAIFLKKVQKRAKKYRNRYNGLICLQIKNPRRSGEWRSFFAMNIFIYFFLKQNSTQKIPTT